MTRRDFGWSSVLLALPFARQLFGQRPVDEAPIVSRSSEDVALNDRRLKFVARLASDDQFSEYLTKFERANAEGKIDVFVEAWGHAAGTLTEVAEKRISSGFRRGLLGNILRALGVGELEAGVDVAAKTAERAAERRKEAGIANIGLENAKSLVGHFIGTKEATDFEKGRKEQKIEK